MKQYQTEQKRLLCEYLRRHSALPQSIHQIAEGLRAEAPALAPGKSTVYRLVNRLVEQGEVRRFVRGNSRHFVYQMLSCAAPAGHLHGRCLVCGRIVHIDAPTSHELGRLLGRAGFVLDEGQTTLLGLCAACGERARA